MKKILHNVLKYTRVIFEYTEKDKQVYHKFNKANPLGWAILITYALFAGTWAFIQVTLDVIWDTLKRS